MRVLAIDAGMTLGYAAVGDQRPVISGSRRLRGGPRRMGETAQHCQDVLQMLLDQEAPDLVAFASPFVGRTFGGAPIPPDNIRPLFGCLTVIEMTCRQMGIACCEIEEGSARRVLLGSIPRGTKNIKAAIIRACKQRGWPCTDDHAGDALCVASFVWECKHRDQAYRTTPLFS
jgi:hypothetical protein